MKDKETTNLLLIMVVSTVLLVFLYLPNEKQTIAHENFTKTKNEVKLNFELQKLNANIAYKVADY